MKDFVDKLIEELEELRKEYREDYELMKCEKDSGVADGLEYAIKRAQELAEKHNNGWIPVSERLPEDDKYILISFKNYSLPAIGRYEEDENGGAFFEGDEDASCASFGLFVNAWQPLPEPYEGE